MVVAAPALHAPCGPPHVQGAQRTRQTRVPAAAASPVTVPGLLPPPAAPSARSGPRIQHGGSLEEQLEELLLLSAVQQSMQLEDSDSALHRESQAARLWLERQFLLPPQLVEQRGSADSLDDSESGPDIAISAGELLQRKRRAGLIGASRRTGRHRVAEEDAQAIDAPSTWMGTDASSTGRQQRWQRRHRLGLGATDIAVAQPQLQPALLSAEQEQQLARTMQEGQQLQAAALKLWQALRRQPTAEELMTAVGFPHAACSTSGRSTCSSGSSVAELQRRVAQAAAAERQLFSSNVGLVASAGRRLVGQGVKLGCLELKDLVAEGLLALRKAIRLYDPSRGVRLSTYAWPAIWRHMMALVQQHGRIVSLSTYLHRRAAEHRAVQRGLTPARQNPTAAEAAQLRFWMRPARSLEQGWVLADRGGNTMRAADLTAGLPEELDAEQEAMQRALVEHVVGEALAQLPPHQWQALCLRYGLQPPRCREHSSPAAGAPQQAKEQRRRRARRQGVEAQLQAGQVLTFKQLGAVVGVSATQARKDCAAGEQALRLLLQRDGWLLGVDQERSRE